MRSLRARLLLASAVVLAGFLGLTGLALDQAHQASADSARRDRLKGHLYSVLAAADLNARNRLELPAQLPEPRLNQVGSGLIAEVRDAGDRAIWRSVSALGVTLAATAPAKPGVAEFHDAPDRLSLAFATRWEGTDGRARDYVFYVAERIDEHAAQIRQFRRVLFGWLAAATVLLLGAQALILSWGLAPLRRLARHLSEMEAGRADTLPGRYPVELQPLVDNLNALLAKTRADLQRYRNALGNLAHSLKTPLAVLRAGIESRAPAEEWRAQAQEQVQSMNRIVDYQLQRAAASGANVLSAPLPVAPLARKLLDALGKVYAAKSVRVELAVAPDVMFRGDEGDLLEMLGNLADNAFKWARTQVRVTARNSTDVTSVHFILCVEDDGPGIAPERAESVRARGTRGDAATPGHGLGLAVVQDIVELYNGMLVIARSSLGGAAVEVRL